MNKKSDFSRELMSLYRLIAKIPLKKYRIALVLAISRVEGITVVSDKDRIWHLNCLASIVREASIEVRRNGHNGYRKSVDLPFLTNLRLVITQVSSRLNGRERFMMGGRRW